ncbi:TadE/TadG family type IV pilus assembly protein [Anatilimnocola floriformis]|uniref:TadE/TadG family type IV pilus assembly protein n=1 Tax=Anatilimnocola floriformis TaxID=2948575 RepID=UPI0020C3D22F|nr:TadE/TadG family type IV pilus assembly protein [Anatilimnocola floriformis]
MLTAQTLSRWAARFVKPCGLFRKQRRGAAAVEFAVVAPVFFLLVFGMVEYGRMVMVQQIIVNSAREGCRAAVLDGSTTAGVKTTTINAMAAGNITITTSNVTVSPDPPSSAEFGDPVTVTVTVPFNQVSWLPSPMYLGGKSMTAATTMRRETVQ